MNNIDKGKAICASYRSGMTISQISKVFKTEYSEVCRYLTRYFEYFYNEPYKPYSERRSERLEELYNKYTSVYVSGLYTRTQLCEMLDCNVNEFEAMTTKYGLNNQWLKTYDGQMTLCNVSKEFKDSIMEFADKYGFKSCRAVAVTAINEFMLQQMMLHENDEPKEEKPVDEYISVKKKEIQQKYYEEHKEEKRKYNRQRYLEDPEEIKKRSRQYYWANAEKIREQKRKKYWEDVEKSRAYGRLKNQRKKQRLLEKAKEMRSE